MKNKTFNNLYNNSVNISDDEIKQLETIVDTYPYFQSAHALLLKGLKQNNNYKFNKALKTAAAVTADRSVLFEYITSLELSTPQIISKKTTTFDEKKEIPEKKIGDIKILLDFSKEDAYPFQKWLELTKKKTITRDVEKNNTLFKNKELINNFIDKNPTITSLPKDSESNSHIDDIYSENELMTETLAKVYLAQKKYSNAVKAYDILILKYPEKSGFFADEIRKIEHLKNTQK